MYYVTAFRHHHIADDRYLVFLPEGVSEWSGPRVEVFLKTIAPYANRIIDPIFLQSLLPELTLDDLDFARNAGLLQPSWVADNVGQSVWIICQRPDRYGKLATWLGESLGREVTLSENPPRGCQPPFLLIHIEENPDPSRSVAFFDQWAPKVSVFQGIFRIDRFLYLENPHIPELGNPGRRDTWAWIRRQYYLAEGEQQNLFTLLQNRERQLPLAGGHLPFEAEQIQIQTFHRIRRLFGIDFQSFHVDEINKILAIDLLTEQKYEYPSRHYAYTEDSPALAPQLAEQLPPVCGS